MATDKQIRNGSNPSPAAPPTFAFTPEAQESRDLTAASQAAAQAAIAATQKVYPIGTYNTTPDVDTSSWLLSEPPT